MSTLSASLHLLVFVLVLVQLIRMHERHQELRAELADAQRQNEVLQGKAYAWDTYLFERRRSQPGLTAKAAAACEQEFRVNYRHLSAECSGDDAPKPSRWNNIDGKMGGA